MLHSGRPQKTLNATQYTITAISILLANQTFSMTIAVSRGAPELSYPTSSIAGVMFQPISVLVPALSNFEESGDTWPRPKGVTFRVDLSQDNSPLPQGITLDELTVRIVYPAHVTELIPILIPICKHWLAGCDCRYTDSSGGIQHGRHSSQQ